MVPVMHCCTGSNPVGLNFLTPLFSNFFDCSLPGRITSLPLLTLLKLVNEDKTMLHPASQYFGPFMESYFHTTRFASLFCLTRPKSPSFYRYAAITAPLAIMLRFSSSGSEGIIVKSSRVTAAEYGILSKS